MFPSRNIRMHKWNRKPAENCMVLCGVAGISFPELHRSDIIFLLLLKDMSLCVICHVHGHVQEHGHEHGHMQ